MQYNKINYLINTETKTNFINNTKNDIEPTVIPSNKIKKEYIYIGVAAIIIIIIVNNK